MEGNSDVSSASTFEAQAIVGAGSATVKQSTTSFFSQSPTRSQAVWLIYLAKVLGTNL